MYNKAIIITDQDVQPEEFSYPLYRLIEAGFDVDLCLTGSDSATDKSGVSLVGLYKKSYPKKYTVGMCQLDEIYDVIILPGGFAPEKVRLQPLVLEFLKIANAQKKIIGAICHGPQILMSAGLCKGKNMTAFVGVKDDLINAGANYMGEGTFSDDNIVTADHYRENPLFMKYILGEYANYVLGNYVGH